MEWGCKGAGKQAWHITKFMDRGALTYCKVQAQYFKDCMCRVGCRTSVPQLARCRLACGPQEDGYGNLA